MSRLCFSALCPSLHIFQSNYYVTIFFPLNKEKHPTFSIPAAVTCINNDQEQPSTRGAVWPTGGEGSLPFGLHWLPKVCCECGFMLMATPPAAQHARDTGAAACGAVCPGSVTCQLKTLQQEVCWGRNFLRVLC